MQKITFDSHGHTLSGNLFVAEHPQPFAFLFIQGWGGRQNVDAAQALADLGLTSMTYDMRGNGDSAGDLAAFSRADFIADAVAAYDFLKQQLGPGAAIGAVGSSFGSYTAVLLSVQRPLACLSLRVPASYPDEGFDEPQQRQVKSAALAAWREEPLDGNNRAFSALRAFTGKIQIIEADSDETIPHQAVQNYVDSVAVKTNLDYVVMENAPHRLLDARLRAEYIKLLTDWAGQFIIKTNELRPTRK